MSKLHRRNNQGASTSQEEPALTHKVARRLKWAKAARGGQDYLKGQQRIIGGYFVSSMGYFRVQWLIILGYLAFQVR